MRVSGAPTGAKRHRPQFHAAPKFSPAEKERRAEKEKQCGRRRPERRAPALPVEQIWQEGDGHHFHRRRRGNGDSSRSIPPVGLQVQPPKGQRKQNHVDLQQLKIIDDERKRQREWNEQFGGSDVQRVFVLAKAQALAVEQPGDQVESPKNRSPGQTRSIRRVRGKVICDRASPAARQRD